MDAKIMQMKNKVLIYYEILRYITVSRYIEIPKCIYERNKNSGKASSVMPNLQTRCGLKLVVQKVD